MYMNLLINENTNEVIVQVTEKHLGQIIKKIRNTSGLSKKLAKKQWKEKMNRFARKHHKAITPVTFEII